MTFWIILVLAVVLSVISLRWRNLFFSFGGTLGWIALWAYNNSYPPTNVAQGSFVHEILMYGSIIMAIGVMIMYFQNRQRGYTGFPMTKKEEIDLEAKGNVSKSISVLAGGDRYKADLHARLARRRRR